MAQFERAISSLAGIEERLRRSLKLVGLQQIDFSPAVVPVVITDYANRPGCNDWRGRKFSGEGNSNVGAASFTSYLWKAVNPVIITRLRSSGGSSAINGSTIWSIGDPSLTTAISMTTNSNSGIFTENLRSGTDRPPLLAGEDQTGLSIFSGAQRILVQTYGAQGASEPTEIHLQEGAWLLAIQSHDGVAAFGGSVGFSGEMF